MTETFTASVCGLILCIGDCRPIYQIICFMAVYAFISVLEFVTDLIFHVEHQN